MQKITLTIKNNWLRLALHKKITILMFGFLLVPGIFFVSLFFNNMLEAEEQKVIASAEYDLVSMATTTEKNINTAISILHLVDSNSILSELLSNPYDDRTFLAYYNEISSDFRNIVTVNPDVRNLRLYIDSDKVPESFPFFISRDRVFEEDWFIKSDDNYSIRIDYNESFSTVLSSQSVSLISFNKTITSSNGKKNIAEVSYVMDDFFGSVYSSKDSPSTVLIETDDEVYANDDSTLSHISTYKYLISSIKKSDSDHLVMKVGNVDYLISSLYNPSGMNYYIVNNLSEQFFTTRQAQYLILAIIVIFFLVLIFLFQYSIKVLLKKIYQTFDLMYSYEKASDIVKIEHNSSDEISQLQEYFNKMIDKVNEFVDSEAKRAVVEKEMEIKALQSQINAHFLYNVLNNIEMMAIIEENYMIADSITALARLLRYSMSWKSQIVSIDQELDYVSDYVSLFNMRFDNSIDLIIEMDDNIKSLLIPKITIQPIVENAIKHGSETTDKDTTIKISGKIIDNALVIEVLDNGVGIPRQLLKNIIKELNSISTTETVMGIGIKNVQERIVVKFGADYGIDIKSKVDEYTKVTLKLPVITENTEIYDTAQEENDEKHTDS